METVENHKKAPLHSFQSKKDREIEKKIDDILNAHREVLARKSKQIGLSNALSFASKKQPSLFYIADKKKSDAIKKTINEPQIIEKQHLFFTRNNNKNKINIEPTEQNEKEKQLAPVKKKKRIGFKKKKVHQKKTPSTLVIKPTKSSEPLPVFEESIAQVKEEEAAWLDNHIKESSTNQNTAQSPTKNPAKIKFSNTLGEGTGKQTQENASGSSPLTTVSNTLTKDSGSSATQASESEVVTEQILITPEQATSEKEGKIDDISPDGQIKYLKEANQLKVHTLERMGYSENQIEEIDFYPIHEPFAYVEIIREKESLDKRYVLLELQLNKDEEYLLKFVQETLDGFSFKTTELESKGEEKYLSEKVDLILDEYMLNIDSFTKKKLLYYLEKESIGLGKLDVIMKDPNIEDISCDGSGVQIFLYHRRYGSLKSNVQFNEEDELTAFVVKLAQKCGKHISISEPMLDATMPDGSRIQMTLSTEVTTKGSTFTIRKFSEDPFSPPDLIEFHTMSSEMVAYMWLAVENGINALIAGGTAAGKTSTLNALCLFIPRESKIVSIEETREINLPHPNWIPGVVRSGFGEVVGNKVIGEIDLYDLMKAALRQRPEYILVGEIRGKEAYVLFQAMATGHTTYSTVHADSAQSLIHRLEGKPIEIPRIMLQTLDIVIIQVISRVKNKRARRCKQIIEIIDIDPTTKEILTNEVFRWDPIEDKFVYSGKSYVLERIRAEKDISREGMISEIKNRTMLLDWMNKNNIREFKKVATIVAQFVDNPTEVMKKIRNKE
jgi:archaeal flagellar protein FlaI